MPLSEETRREIFETLRRNLLKIAPPMVVSADVENTAFEIIGNKPAPYGHDKKIVPGIYFASLAHRKESVAFYFFPLYMNPKMKETAPSLMKCLKGKTCFHFTKTVQVNEAELVLLLKEGVEDWIKSGYMQ